MQHDRQGKSCEACGATVSELRRGRCWGCYARWAESRPVGLGAVCLACGDKRRDNLKQVELFKRWVPMCFNCAGKAARLDQLPQALGDLREAIARERRRTERRYGKDDTRVFPQERRKLDDRRYPIRPLPKETLAVGDADVWLELADIANAEATAEGPSATSPGEETHIGPAPEAP